MSKQSKRALEVFRQRGGIPTHVRGAPSEHQQEDSLLHAQCSPARAAQSRRVSADITPRARGSGPCGGGRAGSERHLMSQFSRSHLHELTTQIPHAVDLAIASGAEKPRIGHQGDSQHRSVGLRRQLNRNTRNDCA